MHIYEQFGVRRIINARSFSTKAGGAPLPPEVVEAMRQAADSCVRMDELQEAASRVIADVTGAQAGIVTSGASAALTLAAAACIAGLDVDRMNRLPHTSGMPCEIVVHRSHRNDYDHALRTAGARFVEVGFSHCTFPYEVRKAITANTVALFFQAGGDGQVMPLREFAEIGKQLGKPTIVDAAAELPPEENLRHYIAAGADLVAFSGGKHLRGPQSTGILCGRADLIFSAALQHQDMDVFSQSWPLREHIGQGRLAGPPHHGIGRGFKVGKGRDYRPAYGIAKLFQTRFRHRVEHLEVRYGVDRGWARAYSGRLRRSTVPATRRAENTSRRALDRRYCQWA